MRKQPESASRESTLARGWTVAGSPGVGTQEPNTVQAEAVPAAESDVANTTSGRREVSNLALVLYGVFGGMYLLYTAGWFFIAQYFASVNDVAASTSGVVGGVLQVVIYWAAALAPAGWFVVVFALSRTKRAWFLPVWLMVGLVVLVPLPLFTTGGS